MEYRNADGTFKQGWPGGPGRPRRTVESEYLASLSDAVSLADWRQVVDRALADAVAGDAKARDWLSRYLLGDAPGKLSTLATAELAGRTIDDELQQQADRENQLLAVLEKLKN